MFKIPKGKKREKQTPFSGRKGIKKEPGLQAIAGLR